MRRRSWWLATRLPPWRCRSSQETLPVTVTGVILPGAQAAVAATRNGHIGVIGTRATISSGAYERRSAIAESGGSVTARACPLLVPADRGRLAARTPITDQIIMQYLEPLVQEGIDTLVLGCTHYPLLRDAIARLLGDEVTLVDSAQNCAHAVEVLLGENLSAPAGRCWPPGCGADRSAGQFPASGARSVAAGRRRSAAPRSSARRGHDVAAATTFVSPSADCLQPAHKSDRSSL